MAVKLSKFAQDIFDHKYAHTKEDGTKETWDECAERVVTTVMASVGQRSWSGGTIRYSSDSGIVQKLIHAVRDRKFIPGGRYLYATGRPFHQTQNCLLLRAEDSREGWADLLHKAAMALMTGAGIGVDYSEIRERGAKISRTGGHATGPVALMQMVNECARGIQQGGSRRSAVWAGLRWSHPDVIEFINMKNWPAEVVAMKEKDFNAPAVMDMTNISVILDKDFFNAYTMASHTQHSHANEVFRLVTSQMVSTAEPGFSVDYDNPRESLRNACTELTSEDDSDICNIGSINLANVDSLGEFIDLVDICTAFLLAGTEYSEVPYAKVGEVREKNRRLGLGLMGVHEWLLKRGYRYEANDELETWMLHYTQSEHAANEWADLWGISRPIKTRAIAPTGSIGILAETTTGIEPIFCVSYKRRYLKGDTWHYQYVVDPTAKRLIANGVKPEDIEDATTLAKDPLRRIKFQAWMQQFVDHGISSTLNLPQWGSPHNDQMTLVTFREILIKYLPKLRGITAYPDGCRTGQPITSVPYEEATRQEGVEMVEEYVDVCELGRAGSCGA